MNRETTETKLLELREQLHEMANVLNTLRMRVDVLWQERRKKAPDTDET